MNQLFFINSSEFFHLFIYSSLEVNVDTIKAGTKTISASKFGLVEERSERLILSEEEQKSAGKLKVSNFFPFSQFFIGIVKNFCL